MTKLYLVWNEGKTECVGFLDKNDADWTATGKRARSWTSLGDPTIGDHFREQYADDGETLLQTEVEIE